MADIASGGSEGLRELGGLNRRGRLKKQSGEDERLKKVQAIAPQQVGRERVKTARREAHAKHRTLLQEGFNPHFRTIV